MLIDVAVKRIIDPSAGDVFAVTDRLLAVPAGLNVVAIRRISGDGELCRFTLPPGSRGLVFLSDERTIAAFDLQLRLMQWHVATGQMISQFATDCDEVLALRYSADSRRLCALCQSDVKADAEYLSAQCKVFVWMGTDEP